MTMDEIDEASNYIKGEVNNDATSSGVWCSTTISTRKCM